MDGGALKIVTEKRGDEWLAQVVHIGDGMHWIRHQRIHYKMSKWLKENCMHRYHISGWQFYFVDEKDLAVFLLKWNNNDSTN